MVPNIPLCNKLQEILCI
ncbi:hypothetical protein LINPERPRIM_LOCUS37744 [Linum perenne]